MIVQKCLIWHSTPSVISVSDSPSLSNLTFYNPANNCSSVKTACITNAAAAAVEETSISCCGGDFHLHGVSTNIQSSTLQLCKNRSFSDPCSLGTPLVSLDYMIYKLLSFYIVPLLLKRLLHAKSKIWRTYSLQYIIGKSLLIL